MTEMGWGGGDGRPAKMPCRGQAGVNSHIKVKHGDNGKAASAVSDGDDESMADRAIQAEIDRATGVPNPDIEWLLP